MANKYEALLNKHKSSYRKEIDKRNHPTTTDNAYTITSPSQRIEVPANTFNALLSSSSSNESLSEVDNTAVETTQPTAPTDKSIDLTVYGRYNRDRLNALEQPKIDHQTHHVVGDESKFTEPGDMIYRNYWRYTILKDGSIHCTNASSNRKKITQLVLRTRTAPYEYINGIPVTNYFAMFKQAERLQHISLSGLNFSNITSLGRCFSDCFELRTVDMSNLDLSKVSDYQHMFDNCISLRSVDFSGSSMRGAVKTDSMFYGCKSISIITLTNLTGTSIVSMNHMFRSCESLRILELPNLQVDTNVEMKKLFAGANRNTDIICPSSVIVEKYFNDTSSESSESPSMENLNDDSLSGSDNEQPQQQQQNDAFPHVLTEEQRANSYRWAQPPERMIPTFVDWED